MAKQEPLKASERWRRRLYLPAYKISEASRYARTSPQTVGRWLSSDGSGPLSARSHGNDLSYLQLIEIAVVAAMRSAGVKLPDIKKAHDYMAGRLRSEHPFAEYKMKFDGVDVFLEAEEVDGVSGLKKLIATNKDGQYAWKDVLGDRLQEFEYGSEGLVSRWRLNGLSSAVHIDPRVSFGAPAVAGVATWAIRDRWKAGENAEEISEDFDISKADIFEALKFENINFQEAA